MAFRVYTSVTYAIVRVSIWVALLALAVFDGVRHRQVRSQGWQLYFALVGSAALFVIKNIFFMGICIEGDNREGWASKGTFGAYIFFADVAEAFWIFLLLALSAGFW